MLDRLFQLLRDGIAIGWGVRLTWRAWRDGTLASHAPCVAPAAPAAPRRLTADDDADEDEDDDEIVSYCPMCLWELRARFPALDAAPIATATRCYWHRQPAIVTVDGVSLALLDARPFYEVQAELLRN